MGVRNKSLYNTFRADLVAPLFDGLMRPRRATKVRTSVVDKRSELVEPGTVRLDTPASTEPRANFVIAFIRTTDPVISLVAVLRSPRETLSKFGCHNPILS